VDEEQVLLVDGRRLPDVKAVPGADLAEVLGDRT
jgi:hypothetical protein